MTTLVSQSPTTQELRVFVGHALGVGYPSLCLIPDKLLSPLRVSSSNQLDSLWPGTIYTMCTMYNLLFTIKIFTILHTIQYTINKNTLVSILYNYIIQKFSLAKLNSNFNFFLGFQYLLQKCNARQWQQGYSHLLHPLQRQTLMGD